MTIVKFSGNGFDGEAHFKSAKEGFKFYFEQCKDDRATVIFHNDEPYPEEGVKSDESR